MSAMQCAIAPTASAAPCPDAEVVFARGTTELLVPVPPTGEAFVSSLRAQLGTKSLGVYGVDYPASMDFPSAVEGIADARSHILNTAANCPNTKMVLGGFSQGAAVIGFVTASEVPDGVSPQDVPAPMPPEVADHVAAVALFGTPSPRFIEGDQRPSCRHRAQLHGQGHRFVCRQRPWCATRTEQVSPRTTRTPNPASCTRRDIRRSATAGQLGR